MINITAVSADFSFTKDESELLVICFDVSERKKAEQEIERLHNENFKDNLFRV